jgi:hypothetical protein
VAAIVSSVLLAGGFVGYRAGAFDRFMAPAPRPADPGDSSAAEASPPNGVKPAPVIMSSSKSIILGNNTYEVETGPAPPLAATEPTPPATSKPMVLFASPKSGPIFSEPPGTSKAGSPPPAEQPKPAP